MSKVVMATLLSWDLFSVVIFLDLICAESNNNITAIIPKNETAALGETVTLQCDGPANAVIWKRETLSFTTFSHRFWKNETTFNNLTSERMSIDPVNPLLLKIHNVQLTDTGNYSCIITGDRGLQTTTWSLTITDPNDEHKAGNDNSTGVKVSRIQRLRTEMLNLTSPLAKEPNACGDSTLKGLTQYMGSNKHTTKVVNIPAGQSCWNDVILSNFHLPWTFLHYLFYELVPLINTNKAHTVKVKNKIYKLL
ncbi:uncharacterized protein LOC105027886 isoform X1 [Esox lucius]|uniref:uncharacterized protein LOC105027886 isoform X1 n=1 Tax=Esox lucius TaxID=8010 RepID=UPI000576F4B9|nr:uncharacterized protein LOC105027886 isoform X1 [Esox lucius]